MADYGYPDGGGEEEDMQWPPAPPAYGYPDDDGGGERPPFVLIDPRAYFADRKNATTAVIDMEAGAPNLRGRLQVTFCAVAPPLVSYFCVHATHMDHTEFLVAPSILATETDGGLALLRALHPACRFNFTPTRAGLGWAGLGSTWVGSFLLRLPLQFGFISNPSPHPTWIHRAP